MRHRRSLILAALLALPAHVLWERSYEPFEARFRLDQRRPGTTFTLDRAQPLYLEYGLIARTGDPASASPSIALIIELNGAEAARIVPERLYGKTIRKIALAAEPVRDGDNVLTARVDAGPGATFDLDGRLQNYHGIAPDFPRVFVVDDRMVAHVADGRSGWLRALRFVALFAGCLAGVALIVRRRGRLESSPRAAWIVASAAVPLWVVLTYSLATPLYIWLSIEALALLALLGAGLGAMGLALARYRVRVLRAALVLGVTGVALEAALRAFNYARPHFIFYSESPNRFRGTPGAPFFDTRLNSRGFNDLEHGLDRPAHVRQRLVALGDSFALGVVPYAANYLTLLESALAADGSVEVINMGVAATEPRDYLTLLAAEGLDYRPDVVLAHVFVGNDFEAPARRWHERSFVAMLVRGVWRVATEETPARQAISGPGVYQDDRPGFARDRFLEIQVERAWIYQPGDPRVPAAVERVAADLRRMRDLAVRAGAEFAVVLIPDETQVNTALGEEIAAAVRGAPLDVDQPNRLLLAALERDGIRALDLLAPFRAAGSARLYKPQDTHWNLAGNQLAATTIAGWLGAR
jgi:hypothetical protein